MWRDRITGCGSYDYILARLASKLRLRERAACVVFLPLAFFMDVLRSGTGSMSMVYDCIRVFFFFSFSLPIRTLLSCLV